MKVEVFAEEILSLLKNKKTEKMNLKWFTLDKMRFSHDPKHVVNYWKVCQALCELGINLLIRKSCSKLTCEKTAAVQTLFHAARTTAAIRRILRHRNKFFASLHDLMHECEGTCLYYDNLSAILHMFYRCLLVGKRRDAQQFFKLPVVDDCYRIVADLTCSRTLSVLGTDQMHVILVSTKIMEFLAEAGDDHMLKAVHKKEISNQKLFSDLGKVINTPRLQELTSFTDRAIFMSEQLAHKLKNYTCCCFDIINMSRYKRLQALEFRTECHAFCSSPECRKQVKFDFRLQHCSACMLARYCSQDCQKRHWVRGHRTQCQSISSMSA